MTTTDTDLVLLCPNCWGPHDDNSRVAERHLHYYVCSECDIKYVGAKTIDHAQADQLERAMQSMMISLYGPRFDFNRLAKTVETRVRRKLMASGWKFSSEAELSPLNN